jgi:hypothetical protein
MSSGRLTGYAFSGMGMFIQAPDSPGRFQVLF